MGEAAGPSLGWSLGTEGGDSVAPSCRSVDEKPWITASENVLTKPVKRIPYFGNVCELTALSAPLTV